MAGTKGAEPRCFKLTAIVLNPTWWTNQSSAMGKKPINPPAVGLGCFFPLTLRVIWYGNGSYSHTKLTYICWFLIRKSNVEAGVHKHFRETASAASSVSSCFKMQAWNPINFLKMRLVCLISTTWIKIKKTLQPSSHQLGTSSCSALQIGSGWGALFQTAVFLHTLKTKLMTASNLVIPKSQPNAVKATQFQARLLLKSSKQAVQIP